MYWVDQVIFVVARLFLWEWKCCVEWWTLGITFLFLFKDGNGKKGVPEVLEVEEVEEVEEYVEQDEVEGRSWSVFFWAFEAKSITSKPPICRSEITRAGIVVGCVSCGGCSKKLGRLEFANTLNVKYSFPFPLISSLPSLCPCASPSVLNSPSLN